VKQHLVPAFETGLLGDSRSQAFPCALKIRQNRFFVLNGFSKKAHIHTVIIYGVSICNAIHDYFKGVTLQCILWSMICPIVILDATRVTELRWQFLVAGLPI
jgi:hypothetical protein